MSYSPCQSSTLFRSTAEAISQHESSVNIILWPVFARLTSLFSYRCGPIAELASENGVVGSNLLQFYNWGKKYGGLRVYRSCRGWNSFKR